MMAEMTASLAIACHMGITGRPCFLLVAMFLKSERNTSATATMPTIMLIISTSPTVMTGRKPVLIQV